MDSDRFDGLTRLIGGSGSRRAIGRAVLATALAPLLRPARSVAAQPSDCQPLDRDCCVCNEYMDPPGQCVVWHDRFQGCCSSNRVVCGDKCCSPGACIPPDASDPAYTNGLCCPEGDTACGKWCCRAGTSCCNGGPQCCLPDQECVGNQCQAPCPTGRVRCGTICCELNQICEGGQCIRPRSCLPTETQCGNACCGDGTQCCRNATFETCCPPGKQCCTGPQGAACCDPASSYCCGGVCCALGRVCPSPGLCLEECPNGGTKCGLICCARDRVCVGPETCAGCSEGETPCAGKACCGKNQVCKQGRCVKKKRKKKRKKR